jgi:hypothetical protein
MTLLRSVLLSASLVLVFELSAHEKHDSAGQEIQPEPVAAGFPDSRVVIRETGSKRVIESNGLPDHETGKFPGRGNPHAIRAQEYRFEVTMKPKALEKPFPVLPYFFGVAVNGVKFDPGTAEFWKGIRGSMWNEEAIVDGEGKLGLDKSNAHVQPDGSYHYHGIPHGLIKQLQGEGKMILVGWAADGFPIYGPWAHRDADNSSSPIREMKPSYVLKKGTRPGGEEGPGGRYDGTYTVDFEFEAGAGDLDECNGRAGVTPEFPQGTYYYVLTSEFPFVPRFFRGSPDESFNLRQGGGPGGPGGPRRRPGGPL